MIKRNFFKFLAYMARYIPHPFGCSIRRFIYKRLLKKMGKKVKIMDAVLIKYPWNIEIGDRTEINEFCFINGMGGIKIGKNCLIAPGVSIVTFDYGFKDTKTPIMDQPYSKKPVVIEDDVWLGTKATIVKGITIGKGSIIGSNSVVTKDIPPYSIAVGSPAKIIKKRE